MIGKCTFVLAIALLPFVCGVARAEEAEKAKPVDKEMVSINSTVPITEEGLRRLGAKHLKEADVAKAATLIRLLGAARTGVSRGQNYTCTSEANSCVCHGWLDCVLAMDECKTPPKNPDGTLCSGEQPCTCTWH